MSLTVLTLLAVTAQRFVGVSAQSVTTTASCQSGWSWTFNSLGQGPCLIAAWLQAPCFDLNFEVPGLTPGFGAYGPAGNGTDSCTCSTVTFSMISACGLCQNDSASTWSAWSVNCSGPSLQQYLLPIPNETAVPHWAYLQLLDDTFDISAAQNDTGPESTASASPTTATATVMITTTASPDPTTVVSISTAPPSTTSTSSSVSTTSTSPTPSSSSTSSFSSSEHVSHKSHAGAIAGGVVGGLVALGLIGSVIAMFLSHRRRNQLAPSSEYGVQNTQPIDVPPQSPPVPPMTQENRQPEYEAGALARPRLYDPSDPNTYPTSSTPVTGHTSSSGLVPHAPSDQSGSYNYIPEI